MNHRAGTIEKAARQALDAAGLTLADIDCLVAASRTMDQGMPCNAVLIHRDSVGFLAQVQAGKEQAFFFAFEYADGFALAGA